VKRPGQLPHLWQIGEMVKTRIHQRVPEHLGVVYSSRQDNCPLEMIVHAFPVLPLHCSVCSSKMPADLLIPGIVRILVVLVKHASQVLNYPLFYINLPHLLWLWPCCHLVASALEQSPALDWCLGVPFKRLYCAGVSLTVKFFPADGHP
jgi:hypothetical protein